jgi:phytanoyl-CoA hydroxylase
MNATLVPVKSAAPKGAGSALPPNVRIDPGSEAHDPALYRASIFARPVQGGLDAIAQEHLDFYEQEGYLAVEDVFTPAEVDAAKHGLLDLIMGSKPDFEGILFEKKAAERLGELSLDERQDAVRKLIYFVKHEARLDALASHPKLLKALGRILGARPHLYSDQAMIKPPHIGREKPWHQDMAFFDLPTATKIAGVWIALDEATVENGCMHVRPQGHQQGPIVHFQRRDWQLCDTECIGKPCVAAPLKPGSVLFFDGLIPHGTPSNHSGKRRKALQFHYHAAGVEKTDDAARLAVFGADGKGVEC